MTTTDTTHRRRRRRDAPAEAPISHLAAHPDNPRRHLGDLTELVRSIKTHGVLQPLLVLPADDHGVHLIVAGHRRLAAAAQAGLAQVPIVVRDLDRARRDRSDAHRERQPRRPQRSATRSTAIAKLISIDGGAHPGQAVQADRQVAALGARPHGDHRAPGPLARRPRATARSPSPRPSPPPAPPTSARTSLDALCDELVRARRLGPRPRPHRRALPATAQARRRRSRRRSPAAQPTACAYFTATDVPRHGPQPLRDLGIADTKRGPHRREPCHAVLHPTQQSWSDRITPHRLLHRTQATPPAQGRQARRLTDRRRPPPQPDRPATTPTSSDAPGWPGWPPAPRCSPGAAADRRRSELMVLALHSFIDHASHDAAVSSGLVSGPFGSRPRSASCW